MFERFTPGARRVVVLAQEECRLLAHVHIGTEHLLLALLGPDTATATPLGEVGVTLADARERIAQSQGRGSEESDTYLPFTSRAKQVLEQSVRHAERLGQDRATPLHLLLAMLDIRDSVAVGCLADFRVDLDTIAARVDGLASTAGPDSEPTATGG